MYGPVHFNWEKDHVSFSDKRRKNSDLYLTVCEKSSEPVTKNLVTDELLGALFILYADLHKCELAVEQLYTSLEAVLAYLNDEKLDKSFLHIGPMSLNYQLAYDLWYRNNQMCKRVKGEIDFFVETHSYLESLFELSI